MRIVRWFAHHPTAANLLLILVAVAGLLSVEGLQRETFPRFVGGEVHIEVPYPGASPTDIEHAVCVRVENALDGIADLEELRCEALESRASAVVEMREGGDFSRFLDEVRTEIGAIDDLPARADPPVVRDRHRTDFVAALAIGGTMSPAHLKSYAEDLKTRLSRLPEIAKVTVEGFAQRQLRVEVPKAVLRQHGLSVDALARTISRQSVDLPGGTLETRERDILLRFADERRTPDELADLVVVAGETGSELRLGDIATITGTFDPAEEFIHFDGQRAAVLEIHKTAAQDSLRVVDALEDFVATERGRMGNAVTLAVTQDISSILRDRLRMLVHNGAQGLVLVFLALWLFFSARFAAAVAVVLPVSFLGTAFLVSALGYSLNMISLTALLMAIGLIMDSAIVIAENMERQLRRGLAPIEAVVTGTSEVAPGVLSSFLTTVAIFLPLSFLSGDIGTVLEVLPIVLLVTLGVSLIAAFLILPRHLAGAMGRMSGTDGNRFRHGFDDRFAWLRDRALGKGVDTAVRWRYAVAGGLLFALLATAGYGAGGHLTFQAFPDIEGDVVEARLLLPQGTPLEETEGHVARIVEALRKMESRALDSESEDDSLIESVQVRFGRNAEAHESGAHVATVIVDLLDADARPFTLDEFYVRWREEIGPLPGTLALTLQEPTLGPQGRAFEIRLTGDNLDDLDLAGREMEARLSAYAGATNVMTDLRPGKPERRLTLREGASVLGLDASSVAEQLRGAFLGDTASEIQVGTESYEIEVRSSAADRSSLRNLDDFTVTLPGGSQVPLNVVARIEPDRGWARIHRVDGQRTVTVTGDIDTRGGNAMQIIDALKRDVAPELAERFPDIALSFEGQASEAASTGASIRAGFLLGLVGIYLILALQFRSYFEPILVMVAIPFAILGAVWGHVVTGYPLSMPSLVGAVSLSGIVVNNSILLAQFVKLHASAGDDMATAARRASRDRFRAITITSLTTILGLLPLLAESSLQAEVLKPLVISVVFGLLTSSVLVLLVLPALYGILADLGYAGRKRGALDAAWKDTHPSSSEDGKSSSPAN